MPSCGSAARAESRLLVASTAAAQSAGASGGPQQQLLHGRFLVCHVSMQEFPSHRNESGNSEQQLAQQGDDARKAHTAAITWDSQCEQLLHSAVGILDSLPWCRSDGGGDGGGGGSGVGEASSTSPAAFQTSPEQLADQHVSCAVTASVTAAAAAAVTVDSCTLTALVAKSISQLCVSASSSNFPSMDCRCSGGSEHAPSAPACNSLEAARPRASTRAEAEAETEAHDWDVEPAPGSGSGEAASHLEPPWSCDRSGSHRPASPASLRQLAAAHRCERVGPALARSASFRQRLSSSAAAVAAAAAAAAATAASSTQHPQQPHNLHPSSDCCSQLPGSRGQLTNEEYLDQLHERVQLWLLGTASAVNPEEAQTEPVETQTEPPQHGFCCGSLEDSCGTVTAATAAMYCGHRSKKTKHNSP